MKRLLVSLSFLSIIFANNSSAMQILNPQKNFSLSNSGVTIALKMGDITELGGSSQEKSAIVNAANETLIGSAGVAKVIQNAAGQELIDHIKKLASFGKSKQWGDVIRCHVGQACITPAFNLEKKEVHSIIHAVGPDCRVEEQKKNCEALLRDAYRNSLLQAMQNGIRIISFPALSTGVFGYDINQATPVALDEVIKTIQENPNAFDEIRFIVYSKKDFSIYDEVITKATNTSVAKQTSLVRAEHSSIKKKDQKKPFGFLLKAAALYAVPTTAMAVASYFANNRTMNEEQFSAVLKDGLIPVACFMPGWALGQFMENWGHAELGEWVKSMFGGLPYLLASIAGISKHTDSLETLKRFEQIQNDLTQAENQVYKNWGIVPR